MVNEKCREITYVSFYKKSFNVQLITKMENKVKHSSEGPNTYALVIWLNEKTIKIRTQSDEQSQSLKDIINSLVT